jgi:tRNA(Ile)-lysidine synthase
MSLPSKIKKFIIKENLFSYGDTVIVGVSGGMDSVALIDILHQLRYDLGLKLIIAHYNHNLRKESKRDYDFVKNLSQDLNIPFHSAIWKDAKKSRKGSLEENCRKKRFNFFQTIYKKEKANHLSLAHHSDDLAETVLMRILRGSGTQGLRGMCLKSKIYTMSVVRPLLSFSRKEIHSYVQMKKINFQEDKTNKDTVFLRNKVRLELLPLLEKNYNLNIRNILQNLSENATIDYDYLKQQAIQKFKKLAKFSKKRHIIQINLENLKKEHPAIIRLLLRHSIEILQKNTNAITATHIKEVQNLLKKPQSNISIQLPKGTIFKKTDKFLQITVERTK